MQTSIREKRINSQPGSVKAFMSKLSKGLLLPMALLPIAGLFLGVGAAIQNIAIQMGVVSGGIFIAADIFKVTGDVVFGNLPILFAIAIAITYTEDAGVAGLSAFIAWIAFNGIQSVLIGENLDISSNLISYNILWFDNVPVSVVGKNVGITSMQTSVFGGLIIGGSVAWAYNKFHQIKMPAALGFFGGTRFIPIAAFAVGIIEGMIILMLWPIMGIGLDKMGQGLAAAPASLDALVFGLVERTFVPFGLHHAFYAPLWFSNVGGTFYDLASKPIAFGNNGIWNYMNGVSYSFSTIGNDIPGLPDGSGTGIDNIVAGVKLDAVFDLKGNHVGYITSGVEPGTYLQGKYPFMMFGLPAAGAAMVMSAKKENRQIALSIIGAASLTSFLTGITEPIEFTFLFLAPVLFFVFHVFMCGMSFWLLALTGTHMGMSFSGGAFDYVLFGILPSAVGNSTGSWHALVLGLIYMPIYYFVFYWYINKYDLSTPGRGDDEIKMMSKSDYQGKKTGGKRSKRVSELVELLGGLNNLEKIDACITRLRLDVKDRNKVNDAGLKKFGATGIVGKARSIQIIFGAEADIFKTELKALKRV